jgi:hypothetical protein
MKTLMNLALAAMLAGALPACHRTKLQENPMEEKTQLVPDPVESAPPSPRPPVVPTPRNGHPGTITFMKKFDGSSHTKPISEFPDSFVFVNGIPVVREEFYSWDENGNPCPPPLAARGEILRYGPDDQLLQSVRMAPDRPHSKKDRR